MFDEGSVLHDRQWCYNLVDQAAAVEVAIVFKARCSFTVCGGGAERTLKIVDDTGACHGKLRLNSPSSKISR